MDGFGEVSGMSIPDPGAELWLSLSVQALVEHARHDHRWESCFEHESVCALGAGVHDGAGMW